MLVYLVTSTSTLKTLFSGLQDTGTQGELGHIRAYVHNATFSTERREIHKGAVQLVRQRSVAPDSLQPDGNLQLSGRVYLSRHRSIVRPDIWVVGNKSPRWPSRKGAVKTAAPVQIKGPRFRVCNEHQRSIRIDTPTR